MSIITSTKYNLILLTVNYTSLHVNLRERLALIAKFY